MAEMFNCPNCGAPITADRCIYCGTTFIDWTAVDMEKANYIKIKHDGHIALVKAYVRGTNMRLEFPQMTPWERITYYHVKAPDAMFIDATLECVPYKPVGYGDAGEVWYIDIDSSKADLQEAGELLHNTMEEDDGT